MTKIIRNAEPGSIQMKYKVKTDPGAFLQLAHFLGSRFADRARQYDENDRFVSENYSELKEYRVFSAMVPRELGGMEIPHSTMCDFIRILGSYCASTALALSMHQHLAAAAVWKYLTRNEGAPLLRKVAEEQLVLVSTGAKDWLDSNGEMKKVQDGYLVNAHKVFASESIAGDVMVTRAPYLDPASGPQVLHFSVPFSAEGVTVLDTWYTMGMRGTGSHTIQLKEVFVPANAISLSRPQGEYHPVWNVVLNVAMPLIMSAYMGVAERAAKMAIDNCRKNGDPKEHIPSQIGKMNNALTTAKVMLADMVDMANDLDFIPSDRSGHDMLTRKTVVADACIQTVNTAMDIIGGQSFLRKFEFERLFRDVQGARFHPLPEQDQLAFSGKFLLGC